MNSTNVIGQIAILAGVVLVAILVWSYYRHRKFPQEKRYRTFGPRFWTGAVDTCVFLPLTVTISFLLSLNIPRFLAAMLVVIQNLAWLVYTVTMHARYGQTIGKMVTKVRVVNFRTEGKISWGQAWLRDGIPVLLSLGLVGYQVYELLSGRITPSALDNGETFNGNGPYWLLTGIPGLWFIAEVLTMLTNRKRRALHDFIAGTVVVRTNIDYESATPEKAPNPGPSVQAPAPVA
jgi:uncharacterized RDD family membrane protein YckC